MQTPSRQALRGKKNLIYIIPHKAQKINILTGGQIPALPILLKVFSYRHTAGRMLKSIGVKKVPYVEEICQAEANFYYAEVWPKIHSGQIVDCEVHKTFLLLPPAFHR